MKQETIETDGWNEVEEEMDDVVYVKWDEPGTEVTGKLVEVFQGKDCKFAKVDTGTEILTMFSVPTLLEGKLKDKEGKLIKVRFVGPIKFEKSGRVGKDFRVFVKEDAEDSRCVK